jgi:hypothetical protein
MSAPLALGQHASIVQQSQEVELQRRELVLGVRGA